MDVQLIGAAVNKTWIHAYEGKRSASKRRETRIRDEMLFMFFFFRRVFELLLSLNYKFRIGFS